MNPAEYEQIVGELYREIYEIAEGIPPDQIKAGYGPRNRLQGVSGYRHQIDVSVIGPQDLILVECKCWTKKVRVEQVLAFAGRVCDIGLAFSGRTIHAAIATTVGFQTGAEMVAKHFNIDLRRVTSPSEFAAAYKNHVMRGLHEITRTSVEIAIERQCSKCGTTLVPQDDGRTFKCPRCG